MRFTLNRFTRSTSLVLATILTAALLPGTALAAKVLRYSDHEPLGGMRTRFIKDVFFAAIEKESNGRLKIEDHWNAELSSGYDALRTVGKGEAADLAIVVPEYMADNLPLHQIFKSFPVGPAGAQQVSFFRRVYAEIPEFSNELAANNAVPVFLATGYPVAFYGTQPLATLADIKGQKWRSASFWHLDFLKSAGAVPVTMHWGEEVYKALVARTLDGLMVNVDSGYLLKVHETAPNVLLSRRLWLGHLNLLTMNRATWEGLAPADKAAVQRAAETAYATLGTVMDSSLDAMVDGLKRDGANVRQLSDDEVEAWKATTRASEVQSAWVDKQEAKGVKEVGVVLQKVQAIMNDAVR
jgi:TRAP-type C4-dicarboxylate transport system substrate-binding protein